MKIDQACKWCKILPKTTKTLPEAQRTQGIESVTWEIFFGSILHHLVNFHMEEEGEIWLKSRNLVDILEFGRNLEILEFGQSPEICLKFWNLLEILKFA